MSDTQRGPGWWLASDGRWYPPESRAQPLPPPPGVASTSPVQAPPLAQYPPVLQAPYPYARPTQLLRGVSTGLGGTIQGFLWAAAGLAALAALMSIAALTAFNSYWNSPVGSRAESSAYDDWIAFDDALSGFAGFTAICGIVLFILLIIWMHKAHTTTQQLWQGSRQWTSGWTIGGWFIPIANLVIPKLVLSEIERIALAPRVGGAVDASFKTRPTLAVGKLWWTGIVVGWVFNLVASALSGDEASDTDLRVGYVFNALGLAALAASGVFGALYVRRLGRRLSDAGIAESP